MRLGDHQLLGAWDSLPLLQSEKGLECIYHTGRLSQCDEPSTQPLALLISWDLPLPRAPVRHCLGWDFSL